MRFIFQPAEELFPGGAAGMIEAGVLADVASVFGIHVWANPPTRGIGTRSGPFMAAVNGLHVRIIGQGGHAAAPQQTIDPVVVAAQVVLALQTVVSRSIGVTDSAVVSVTKAAGGTADNVIPRDVVLGGTIRTLGDDVRTRVCQRVQEIAAGVARGHGATTEVDIALGYPALVNDGAATERVWRAAHQLGYADEQSHGLASVSCGRSSK
ncbi:MAG: amidohydrolase [Planctomycetes bacterium]|nr:amidohydrolase [Planctomycetota bacterium]